MRRPSVLLVHTSLIPFAVRAAALYSRGPPTSPPVLGGDGTRSLFDHRSRFFAEPESRLVGSSDSEVASTLNYAGQLSAAYSIGRDLRKRIYDTNTPGAFRRPVFLTEVDRVLGRFSHATPARQSRTNS